MIQQESYLNVADNSGARRIQCIRVLGTGSQFVGSVGDVHLKRAATSAGMPPLAGSTKPLSQTPSGP